MMKTSRKPDEHDKAKGRDLAQLRRDAGLSQEQLAARLGVSLKQVGKYERGQSRIPVGRYEAAMQILRPMAAGTAGFAEGQSAFVGASDKDFLLRALKGMVDEFPAFNRALETLKLCIKIIEKA